MQNGIIILMIVAVFLVGMGVGDTRSRRDPARSLFPRLPKDYTFVPSRLVVDPTRPTALAPRNCKCDLFLSGTFKTACSVGTLVTVVAILLVVAVPVYAHAQNLRIGDAQKS